MDIDRNIRRPRLDLPGPQWQDNIKRGPAQGPTNPYRQEALATGWTPNWDKGRTGYDTLSDDMRAQRRDMPYDEFMQQKYGSSPQELRQAERQAGRTPNLSDAGFGTGASLSGVTDFNTWASVMRNPQYQAGRDAFLAGPGMEEQLARNGAPAIQRGPDGVPDVQGSLQDAGMWNAAPEQPYGNLFDTSGTLYGRGEYGPSLGREPIDATPFVGNAPQPSTFQPPTGPFNFGSYQPQFGEGGRDSTKKGRNWDGTVRGPEDGRPVMGNFGAGRRRKMRQNVRQFMRQNLRG